MPFQSARRDYWLKNTRLTIGLLAVWFVITFVAGYFAVNLNRTTFFGFPLGFYLFAQGSVLVFIALVAIYVRYMNRLDQAWRLDLSHQSPTPGDHARRVPRRFDDSA